MSEIDAKMAPIERMLERVSHNPHYQVGLLKGIIIGLLLRSDADAVRDIHEIVNRITK